MRSRFIPPKTILLLIQKRNNKLCAVYFVIVAPAAYALCALKVATRLFARHAGVHAAGATCVYVFNSCRYIIYKNIYRFSKNACQKQKAFKHIFLYILPD